MSKAHTVALPTRPAPAPPVTPRKVSPPIRAKNPPRRPHKTRVADVKERSASSPKGSKGTPPVSALNTNIPVAHQIPTKKERATAFHASSPKAKVRPPSARLKYLAEAKADQHRQVSSGAATRLILSYPPGMLPAPRPSYLHPVSPR